MGREMVKTPQGFAYKATPQTSSNNMLRSFTGFEDDTMFAPPDEFIDMMIWVMPFLLAMTATMLILGIIDWISKRKAWFFPASSSSRQTRGNTLPEPGISVQPSVAHVGPQTVSN